MTCSRCQLVSPPAAERCPCGAFLQLPAPAVDPDSRTWASATHLAALAGCLLPLGAVLGPLVVWLVRRRDSAFIDSHGRAAVNFQITMTLVQLAILGFAVASFFSAAAQDSGGAVIASMILFVIAFLTLGMASLGFAVFASIRASNGKGYQYPLAIPFVRSYRWPPP